MAGFGMPTTLLQAIGDRIQANVMAIQTFVDALMHGFVHKYLQISVVRGSGFDARPTVDPALEKGITPDPLIT